MAILRGPSSSPSSAPPGITGQQSFQSASIARLTTAAQQKSAAEDGPWMASQDYFAGTQKNRECPAKSPRQRSREIVLRVGELVLQLRTANQRDARLQDKLHSQLWCIPDGKDDKQMAAMIAMVPDPVETDMQLQFDRTVDALQLAAESSLFVTDRYWLPWPRVHYRSHASPAPPLQDEVKRQEQPGLLIFRKNGPTNKNTLSTLYMFLVAETPTAGVNGWQFAKAVDYIEQVCAKKSCRTSPIAIAGPLFSGSLASLRRLTDNRPADRKFHAYSGSISSACALWMQGLKSDMNNWQQCVDGQRLAPEKPNNLFVKTLVHDTESALPLVNSWLRHESNKEREEDNSEKDIREKDIGETSTTNCHPDFAILSETATAYAQTASRTISRRSVSKTNHDCYIVFEYPRGISSLRNARAGPETSATLARAGNDNLSQYLPFNLADRDINRKDEPPEFSTTQGPLSKEAVLMSFATELRRQHIQNAGIVGSNDVDVLFLARFVRASCPNVRLFVLNADLLFERELDNGPYIGTLTLTTYPLIPRNLEWVQGGMSSVRILPLVEQHQEGEYNAALLAIWCSSFTPGAEYPELLEDQFPFQARVQTRALPVRYGSDLPVWLTAVGYGGYWPVGVLGSKGGVKPELRDEDFSSGWKAVALILCAFGFGHVVWLFHDNWPLRSLLHNQRHVRSGNLPSHQFLITSGQPIQKDWRSERFAGRVLFLFGPDPNRRFFFINMANAALVAAIGITLSPVFFRSDETGWLLKTALWLTAVLIGALLLTSVGFALLLGTFTEKSAIWPRIRILAILPWAVMISVNGWWWTLLSDDPSSHYGFFFAYRSAHLATGVSPLTPMLLLLVGLYCWAVFELWRLKFHDEVRPRLRPGAARREPDLPGGDAEKRVSRSVNELLLRPAYQFLLWLVFILWSFSLQLPHPFHIFERGGYQWLFGSLFCLLVFLMLSSGFRLHQIWSDLRKLLAELDQSPLRAAFERVRQQSWSPIWDSGVQAREWTNVERCLQILQDLRAHRPKPPRKLEREIRKLATSVAQELSCDQTRDQIPDRTIQLRLFGLVQSAISNLKFYWGGEFHHWRHQENRPDSVAEADYIHHMQKLEEFVALRYVAFIGGVLYQLRLLIIVVTILFTLILLSLNIYSFEPHQSLIWSLTVLFVVIGAIIVNLLRQVHYDNVLSLVTGSTPDKLDPDFYFRVLKFGTAPLLTLLITHFPAIGRFVFSLLQPGLEAMK
jgi:hypothetical protein